MTNPDTTSLSDRVLAELRAELGRQNINRVELARRLGVERNWVHYRFSGETPLRLDDLQRIADALGVSIAQLLPAPEPTPGSPR